MTGVRSIRSIMLAILLIGCELAVLVWFARISSRSLLTAYIVNIPVLSWFVTKAIVVSASTTRVHAASSHLTIVYGATLLVVIALQDSVLIYLFIFYSDALHHYRSITVLAAYLASVIMFDFYAIERLRVYANNYLKLRDANRQ
jgi:hypothetical protein